jgi:hypothetical protein
VWLYHHFPRSFREVEVTGRDHRSSPLTAQ